MPPLRRHPRLALVALGLGSVLLGTTAGGELFHGYGKSGGAYLLHAGVFVLLLAGSTTVGSRHVSVGPGRRGVAAVALALVLLYPLSVLFIWYDLVVTPPPYYGADPTLAGLAADRLGFVLALAPLGAGYVLGADRGSAVASTATAVPATVFLLVLGGPTLAYGVAVANGAHQGFSLLVYLLLGVAGVVGSVPLYVVARSDARSR